MRGCWLCQVGGISGVVGGVMWAGHKLGGCSGVRLVGYEHMVRYVGCMRVYEG